LGFRDVGFDQGAQSGLGSEQATTGPGALNELAIFSGVEKRIMGKNFRGGRLVAVSAA